MPRSPLLLDDTDVVLSSSTTMLAGAAQGKYPDGNSLLIRGSDGVVLIDPSLTVHRRSGGPAAVDRILLSHAHEDHMSGISSVEGAAIHAHTGDLPCVHDISSLVDSYIMDDPDRQNWESTLVEEFHLHGWPQAVGFEDGDIFDLGDITVTVMHLPGHTRGHSAFVIEPDGIAFVGDVDLSTFGPYYGDHWSDLDDFVDSIARVRQLDMRRYVTFHHKGVVEGRDEFVRQLDAFASVIDRRDERLLSLLDRPKTLAEIAADGIIYRPGGQPAGWGNSVERRSITMHLARLVRNGVVAEDAGTFSQS